MNSIAYMNSQKPKPTKESMALDAAMIKHGIQNAALAHHVGVSDGLVSQWRRGRRPVPAPHAPKVARFVDVQSPGMISAEYAQVHAAQTANAAPELAVHGVSDDLAIRRLENSVDSLRFAISAMTTAAVTHRQAEAQDVAKLIRKHAPPKFVRTGFLAELLQALDKA